MNKWVVDERFDSNFLHDPWRWGSTHAFLAYGLVAIGDEEGFLTCL